MHRTEHVKTVDRLESRGIQLSEELEGTKRQLMAKIRQQRSDSSWANEAQGSLDTTREWLRDAKAEIVRLTETLDLTTEELDAKTELAASLQAGVQRAMIGAAVCEKQLVAGQIALTTATVRIQTTNNYVLQPYGIRVRINHVNNIILFLGGCQVQLKDSMAAVLVWQAATATSQREGAEVTQALSESELAREEQRTQLTTEFQKLEKELKVEAVERDKRVQFLQAEVRNLLIDQPRVACRRIAHAVPPNR